MSSRQSGRKKSYDNKNRKALYEKRIPYISQSIWNIIGNSRNFAFKMHCQELLQVDHLDQVQEALSSKLFMLTLGNEYSSESTSLVQEENELQTTSTRCADTAFGDLANHFERDVQGNHSRVELQPTIITQRALVSKSQSPEECETVMDKSDTDNFDEDFESFKWDEAFNEVPLRGLTTPESSDQRVPCCNRTRNDERYTSDNSQSKPEKQTTHVEETRLCNDDDHYAALGDFHC